MTCCHRQLLHLLCTSGRRHNGLLWPSRPCGRRRNGLLWPSHQVLCLSRQELCLMCPGGQRSTRLTCPLCEVLCLMTYFPGG